VAYVSTVAGVLALTVLSVNMVLAQPLTAALLLAAGLALLAGLPGLVYRRMWFLSIPFGIFALYVVWWVVMPLPQPAGEPGAQMDLLEQVAYYVDAMRLGAVSYRQDVYPLTLDGAPEMRLLVATVWYAVAWLACLLGVSLYRPLLGMGVLGVIIGMCCGINRESHGLWAAMGFLVLFGLTLALTRTGRRVRPGARSVGLGLGLSAFAAFLALGLLTVVPTLAHPGLPQLAGWDPFRLAPGPEVVFNWRQNYPLLLDPDRDYPIMRVTSPVVTYWRANVLDVFTGDSWISRGTFLTQVDGVDMIRDVPAGEQPILGRKATQTFEVDGLHTTYLFTGGYPTRLTLGEAVRVYSSSAMALRAEKSLGPRFQYAVEVVIPQVRPEDLVGLGRDYPETVKLLYEDLPLPTAEEARQAGGVDQEWLGQGETAGRWVAEFQGIYALNDSIVGEADDPYEVALRIERYLRTHYRYELEPRASSMRSAYAAFLLDTKQGFCQHFAGAMALLLRLNGIPARVAVGFVTGEEIASHVYQVTTNNAHAWVEAYFPGYGWLSFDPTPGRTVGAPGVSLANAGFVDPYPESSPTTASTLPSETGQPAASGQAPEEGGLPLGGGIGAGKSSAGVSPFMAVVVAVAGVALGWPLLVAVKRDVPTRIGAPEERLRATIRRLVADMKAWGVYVAPSLTLDEVAELVDARLGIDLRPLVEKGQGAAFGALEVDEEEVAYARGLAARVRRRLRTTRGWSRSLRAWYGIPVSPGRAAAKAGLQGRPPEAKGKAWT